MICPGTTMACDNPGCRRGGCQGRKPELPLFQAVQAAQRQTEPAPAPVILLHSPTEEPAKPKRLAA